MAPNGNPIVPRQKSTISSIKKLDSDPPSRSPLDEGKSYESLKKSPPQATMLRKATVAALKTENPQLAHLFDSNCAPSDAELEIIRRNLKAAKAEQLRYRRMEPPGRYSHGQQLESRIFIHNAQQMNMTITYWTTLLAPIRRVPPEILCHIFFCLIPLEIPRPQRSWRRRMLPRVDAPFVLLHICRYWRDLASSTSTLWRRLPDISLCEIKPDLVEGRLAPLLKCVDLAKQDFEVYIRGPRWEQDPLWNMDWVSDSDPIPQPLVDFLCRTSHLWTVCTVSAPQASLGCLAGIKGKIPNLRKLTLFFGNRRNQIDMDARNYKMDLFEHAPLLQSLHIAGPHDGHIVVPMDQLTHLKDHSLGELSSSRLLRSPVYPNLLYLELTDRPMESSTILEFPRLKHLQLDSHISIATGCMPRLRFPSLLRLVVLAESGTGDILGVVQRAIVSSGCTTMQSFSGYYAHNPGEVYYRTSLSSVLAITPNLSQLELIANPADIRDLASFYCQEKKLLPGCNIYVASPIRGDATAAFQQLTVSWRGDGNRRSDNITSLSSQFDKRTLKICPYKSTSLCNPPQRPTVTPAMLERWFSDPRKITLHDLSVKLRATGLGEAVCASECYRYSMYFDTIQEREEFSDLLSRIESYTPKNGKVILISNIHFVMSRLATRLIPTSYPGNPVHRMQEQILRIMKKWHDIMMNESLDEVYWIWTTSNELRFVPDSADVRKDKNRWTSIVLGMPTLHTEV